MGQAGPGPATVRAATAGPCNSAGAASPLPLRWRPACRQQLPGRACLMRGMRSSGRGPGSPVIIETNASSAPSSPVCSAAWASAHGSGARSLRSWQEDRAGWSRPRPAAATLRDTGIAVQAQCMHSACRETAVAAVQLQEALPRCPLPCHACGGPGKVEGCPIWLSGLGPLTGWFVDELHQLIIHGILVYIHPLHRGGESISGRAVSGCVCSGAAKVGQHCKGAAMASAASGRRRQGKPRCHCPSACHANTHVQPGSANTPSPFSPSSNTLALAHLEHLPHVIGGPELVKQVARHTRLAEQPVDQQEEGHRQLDARVVRDRLVLQGGHSALLGMPFWGAWPGRRARTAWSSAGSCVQRRGMGGSAHARSSPPHS